MSSRNNAEFNPRSMKSLRAEDFVISADGGQLQQLTHFNSPGFAESTTEQSAATKAAWSPDGSQLILEQLMMGKSYNSNDRSRFYRLTFAGRCGNQ